MIIWRTIGSRSSAMNMCSVRQSPMPSAPNSRALAASSGVSALARTRSRRTVSAQPRMVSKFSSDLRGNERNGATDDPAGAPVDRHHVALVDVQPTDCRRAVLERQLVAARDGRLAHAAGDDGRMRGHPAMGGEDALRPDQPMDVVGSRLPPDEDDVFSGPSTILRDVGVEDDLTGRSAGRGVEALRNDLDLRRRVDHRMEELVELAGSILRDRLVPRDEPVLRHVDGDPQGRGSGALAGARLEEVEASPPRP